MISKEEWERQMKLVRCMRCGTRKDREKFTDAQIKTWWATWCKSCEKTPIGQIAQPLEDM